MPGHNRLVDSPLYQHVFPILMKTRTPHALSPVFRAFFLALFLGIALLSGCASLNPFADSEAPPTPGQLSQEAGIEIVAPPQSDAPHESQQKIRVIQRKSPLDVENVTPSQPATSSAALTLQQSIDELLHGSALSGGKGTFALYIVNLKDGTSIYKRNVSMPLIPASNMKLFTTAAALDLLSPDYVFTTRVEATGNISAGILQGDLVIKGSGDPTIAARDHGYDPEAVFKEWAARLKQMGITTITGNLVGDTSLFLNVGYCPGWDPDDEPIWYAAQSDALSLNENVIKVFVRPDKRAGRPVHVELEPQTAHVHIQNRAKTGGRGSRLTLEMTRQCGTNVIEIRGKLPTRFRERVRTLTVEDPAGYFMDVLARVLQEHGITIQGGIRVVRQPGELPTGRPLFTRASPPISQLVSFTNRESNNFYAEQFLRTLGAEFQGRGSRENGAKTVSTWLQGMGVPTQDFSMYDGSGLSRLNRITVEATITLLRHMYASKNFAIYKSSLPLAGKSGTLHRRMRGTPAYNMVHAKTGYMKGVSSLGGYTTTMDGTPVAFAMMYNGRYPSTSYVKDLENKICVLLRTHALRSQSSLERGTVSRSSVHPAAAQSFGNSPRQKSWPNMAASSALYTRATEGAKNNSQPVGNSSSGS